MSKSGNLCHRIRKERGRSKDHPADPDTIGDTDQEHNGSHDDCRSRKGVHKQQDLKRDLIARLNRTPALIWMLNNH